MRVRMGMRMSAGMGVMCARMGVVGARMGASTEGEPAILPYPDVRTLSLLPL